MPKRHSLEISLIAYTACELAHPDENSAEALAKYVGGMRQGEAEQSRRADYLRAALENDDQAILEHSYATIEMTGLSRAAAAQLWRHRDMHITERSRVIFAEPNGYVVPEAIKEDEDLLALLQNRVEETELIYKELYEAVEGLGECENALIRKALARDAAAALIPDAMTTHLVVTASLRGWRQFIRARGAEIAHREVREIALECLRVLQRYAPVIFSDFEYDRAKDGSIIVQMAGQ